MPASLARPSGMLVTRENNDAFFLQSTEEDGIEYRHSNLRWGRDSASMAALQNYLLLDSYRRPGLLRIPLPRLHIDSTD